MTSPPKNLTTSITSDRQRFVDEPVFIDHHAKPLAVAINRAFLARARKMPPRGVYLQPVLRELSHFERVRLRWRTPDGALKYARDR